MQVSAMEDGSRIEFPLWATGWETLQCRFFELKSLRGL